MSKYLNNVLLALVISLLLPFGNIYLHIVLFLFIIEIMRMINSKNPLPIKEITSLLMVLQLLVAPAITYYKLNNISNYPMNVDEGVYFTFTIPSYVIFLFGLYFPYRKYKIEISKPELIISPRNLNIGIYLFCISIVASVLFAITPSSLSFIMVLFSNFIFVSIFYIFFSTHKYRYFLVLCIFIIFAAKTIASGIFINLFIWGFFIFSLFAYKIKFSGRTKLLLLTSAFFIAFLVQSFKKEYREEIFSNSDYNSSEVEIFFSMAYDRVTSIDELFSLENTDKFVSRLNQGWILSRILNRMPADVQFANGSYFFDEIKGIILPRFVYSGKATVGSHDKFLYFTGLQLSEGTAMNVGIFGDGYGNFGYAGNLIFAFLFGFLINYALYGFYKLSRKYPTLIMWLPFIFFYVMRAGNEFYIIVNWVVKSSILVLIIFLLFKKYFIVKPQVNNE